MLYSNITEGLNAGKLIIYLPEKLDTGMEHWRSQGWTSMDIELPMIAYVKFLSGTKAVEFKLTFADLFEE